MLKPISGDLDIADAATELKTSKKFVRDLIADKKLPAYRIKGSRLIRIRRADLDALKVPVIPGTGRQAAVDRAIAELDGAGGAA